MSTAEQVRPTLQDLVLDEVHAEMGRRRMSGAALARRLGKPQSSIARRLDGRQTMDLDDLEMIADALGVSAVQLLAEAARRAANEPTQRAVSVHYPSDSANVVNLFSQVRARGGLANRERIGQPSELSTAS